MIENQKRKRKKIIFDDDFFGLSGHKDS